MQFSHQLSSAMVSKWTRSRGLECTILRYTSFNPLINQRSQRRTSSSVRLPLVKSKSCRKVISSYLIMLPNVFCPRIHLTCSETFAYACHRISYTTAVAIWRFHGSFKDLRVGFNYETCACYIRRTIHKWFGWLLHLFLRLMSWNEYYKYTSALS